VNVWRATKIVTIVYWIGIFTLTHLPPNDLPKTQVSDKLAHFVVYSLLTSLIYISLWKSARPALLLGACVLLTVLAYGAFDELTQPYFHRTCDIHDWYADALGATSALIVLCGTKFVIGNKMI
jgi:VanZ family protein